MDEKSALWGANKERTAILAKVRRMIRENQNNDYGNYTDSLNQLIDWLLQRNERYNKRKGGLGR